MLRGMIFDMDGVIIDSHPIHKRAWKRFFQSLGFNYKKLTPRLAMGGRIFAWLLFVGYTSIPVAILLGLIKPAQQL